MSNFSTLVYQKHTTHVIIAGNIGVGKSSLVERLSEAFGWTPFYEAADENPYLADFYNDMPRWAFHSQLFFLGRRVRLLSNLFAQCGPVVQDRSLYEDAEVFAANLHQQGALDRRDYETYRTLYESLCVLLPPPDLLVYLRADVPTLLSRIALRGRSFEQDMAPDYLAHLNTLYDDWMARWHLSASLAIQTDGLDFVRNPSDLNAVFDQIQVHLPIKETR
ncbi:MAG: deoxynucleoside kinase [Aggregatilineales bacterium]